MISDYLRAAMAHAKYEILDVSAFAGYITERPGVLAQAITLEKCREEPQEDLEGGIILGLKHSDHFDQQNRSIPRNVSIIHLCMIRYFLFLAVFLISASGCRTVTEPRDFFSGSFFEQDPVTRASCGQFTDSASQNSYDVGIALMRGQLFNGQAIDSDSRFSAVMAFEKGREPVEPGAGTINGVSLKWIPRLVNTIYWCDIFRSADTAAYGRGDSMSFAYSGFDGDSFSGKVAVAPRFGEFTLEDTLSVSHDFQIKYKRSEPGENIHITFRSLDSPDEITLLFPDTGSAVIPANTLSYTAKGINEYEIRISRTRFQVLTSNAGKRIGVYSMQSTLPEVVIPVKP